MWKHFTRKITIVVNTEKGSHVMKKVNAAPLKVHVAFSSVETLMSSSSFKQINWYSNPFKKGLETAHSDFDARFGHSQMCFEKIQNYCLKSDSSSLTSVLASVHNSIVLWLRNIISKKTVVWKWKLSKCVWKGTVSLLLKPFRYNYQLREQYWLHQRL